MPVLDVSHEELEWSFRCIKALESLHQSFGEPKAETESVRVAKVGEVELGSKGSRVPCEEGEGKQMGP